MRAGRILRGMLRAAGLAAGLALAASCRRGAAPQAAAPAEPLSVEVRASTNVVGVGTPVRVVARIAHPAGARLEYAEPGRGKTVIVRDRRATTRAEGPGREVSEIAYTLASFEVGDHEVFTGAVRAVSADGKALEKPWPFAAIRVASSLAGTNDAPRGLKGPVLWPPSFPRWLWVLPLIAVLALAAALTAAWLLRRAKAPAPPPPLPPAHVTALAALARLRAQPWMERGEVEPFFVELSAIVRRYLEDRFGLRAPERTTEEFILEAASSDRLSAAHQQTTRAFLEQSDRVKFARDTPGRPEMEGALASAERLVRETTPPPEDPSGAPAAAAGGEGAR